MFALTAHSVEIAPPLPYPPPSSVTPAPSSVIPAPPPSFLRTQESTRNAALKVSPHPGSVAKRRGIGDLAGLERVARRERVMQRAREQPSLADALVERRRPRYERLRRIDEAPNCGAN